MRLDLLSRILFVIYCFEAGAVLLFIPWGSGWDRMMVQIPVDALRNLTLQPLFRSLVSGFGLVHWIWAIHDLDLLLARWRARERPHS